jgi:hypothetical protein
MVEQVLKSGVTDMPKTVVPYIPTQLGRYVQGIGDSARKGLAFTIAKTECN